MEEIPSDYSSDTDESLMKDIDVVALDPLNVIENNKNENCIIVDEGNANQTASSLLNKKSKVKKLVEKRRWRKKEETLINCTFNESRSNLYFPKSPLDAFLYFFNDVLMNKLVYETNLKSVQRGKKITLLKKKSSLF